MSAREEELERALASANVDWSAAQTERGLVRLQRTVARRRALTLGAAGAVLIAASVVFAFVRFRSHEVAEKTLNSQPAPERVVRFSDGSTVHLLDATSDVSVVEARPERIVAALEHGSATFEVSHVEGRVFRVQAGQIIVEALGTVFTVERGNGRVRVSVGRGRVRVDYGTGNAELAVGESGTFPPLAPEITAPPVASVAPPPAAPAPKASASQDSNSVESLLLAADKARLAGHPAEAVPYLQRILRDFKGDPRASLAAFSLGRVLSSSLGRPGEAAAYFEQARALAREPSLAEDALAREVEALARAGQEGRAHRRAEDYLRLYPNGQRTSAVKTFGGIE